MSGSNGTNHIPRRFPFWRRHFAGTAGLNPLALQGTVK
jgi:hypothetical protein